MFTAADKGTPARFCPASIMCPSSGVSNPRAGATVWSAAAGRAQQGEELAFMNVEVRSSTAVKAPNRLVIRSNVTRGAIRKDYSRAGAVPPRRHAKA